MLSIPGYQITEALHSGSKTLVYRGYREQDKRPMIFKTLNGDYPAVQDLACLQHEYALTLDWEENGWPRSYELLRHHNTQILIQQDIGGVSLNQLLNTQALSLDVFLTLALALAKSLHRIHQRNLIHKDINPSNLVVNLDTAQVQIIDFGIATQLSRETPMLQNPGHLEGTLAYLSPEQTGRMNRALDYRTDFYSLGATFYEMLTGVPPFATTDPMELVHCHLAKVPLPIHEHRPELPPVLNELVQKLMAKTAEARYQSAFGLIADLKTCRTLFDNSTAKHTQEAIPSFPICLHDVSERFHIPQKLYGRETQVQQVLDAFARVSLGRTEMLLVAGYSGIGKTALVHELHKPISEKNGYCIDGKFDQFQRNIPYASLIQAFQELLRQLLTESQARIARWKKLLENALGEIAQVIIDVIPEVEWIMGQQAAVPVLPPAQAQNRFNLAFQQFIRTFATGEHPLVLFLDDLQWADLPSLQLIQLFMSDPEMQYLMVVGAYRDNEVQLAHPLMLTLEEIQKTHTRLATITLKPLKQPHVQQLLAETLYCDLDSDPRLATLAELCIQKTRGNPFFLNQFLRALVEAGQIRFDHASGRWQWDMAQLQQTQITNNVVDLMAKKIKTLPSETQALIRLAACVGNQFDLNTLTWASEQPIMASIRALWPALQENLLIPLDDAYKYIGFNPGSTPGSNPGHDQAGQMPSAMPDEQLKLISFKFAHDRIQQAAYSLIGEDSKAIFHLRIGRRLLANLQASQKEERIFDLVYHLNKGQELLTLASEKETLARLNLQAGEKANASAAYKPASSYLQAGLKLMDADGWEKHYELTLSLSVGATEAAYLSGDFEQTDRLAKMVLQKTKTLLEQVKVYQIQISARILQNRSLDAIKLALPVLKQLGVRLPAKPSVLHVLTGLLETKLVLGRKKIEDLANLPAMTHANAIAATQILSSISPAVYFAMPDLLPLIFFKQVCLSIKHGNTALSSYAYAGYGAILCGALGDIDAGYRFGTLAVAILEKFSANTLKVKVFHLVENHIKHWKDPFQNAPAVLLDAYQSGVQTGDFEYAAYVGFNYCHFLYFTGRELPEVHRELEKYTQAIAQFKQEPTLQWQKISLQTVANLMGQTQDPCRLQGNHFDNETNPIPEGNRTGIFLRHAHTMILCYLFQRYPQALEQAIAAEKYLDSVVAHLTVAPGHFYMALVRLALVSEMPHQRRQLLRKVGSLQKKLKQWADHAPANNLHKWHLVEAERARILGDDLAAIEHYEQAISLARKNDYPQETALANELAARFYLSRKRKKIARMYLLDAHYGYQQWGASAKTRQLEELYPQWFPKAEKRTIAENLAITFRTFTAEGSTSGVLDLETVMKASQSISGEIVLERLLEKLMRIAIENAGAEKGFLILKSDGQWRIEAAGDINRSQVDVLQSLPLQTHEHTGTEPSTALPVTLVQYVELTREPLVLNHASARGRFVNDPYIRTSQAKSVLCAPILLQGKLAGILYLENNLIEAAFTADRLEVLKILSSQAAISIENARVYENLESTVAQRTAALSESNTALSHAFTAAETARQHAETAEHHATRALEDLRAAQTQVVQSAKMASLGHLVAGVAHELNTPIGNALTSASMLSDTSKGVKAAINNNEILKSTLADFIENSILMTDVINQSCQRAANLINSFKQVAVDQTSEQRRIFDLALLVEDNIAALRAGFQQVPWVFETHIPADITCDSYPGPLGQVIANLVQNAVIHAFAGRTSGTLMINAKLNADADSVEMHFLDNGNGMDESILPHIFEPFYTTRQWQGQEQVGPGLGLSISLNIATGVLGGTLSAHSQAGSGSQFYLTFPRRAPDSGSANTLD